MRNLIFCFIAAALLATSVEAQVRVNIPGTGVNVRVGDPPRPYYNRNYNRYNYNQNRGFWIDGRGYARWNGGYYTGWRGNKYYSNGRAVRHRNGRNVIWIR